MKNFRINSVFLLFCTTFFVTSLLSAQWVKQTLPTTQSQTHMQAAGTTVGKNVLWLQTIDAVADTNHVAAVEFVRTADGGRTYQKGTILPNNDEYYYSLRPFDATTAYLSAFEWATGESSIFRTVDAGASWQQLSYHPTSFIGTTLFYDANNGFVLADPDDMGAFFAHTTDGGKTFTRVPQTNLPKTSAHEAFNSGTYQILGNAIFQPMIRRLA